MNNKKRISIVNRLTAAVISVGMITSRAPAEEQPSHAEARRSSQSDPLQSAADSLNLQRDRAFRARDLRAIGALYTPDAIYVELLPALNSIQGRTQIEIHFQELFDANTSNLDTTVRNVTRTSSDTALVTGDYSLVVSNRIIGGHFLQILRLESGTWKIAQHVFARPEAITERERGGGTD